MPSERELKKFNRVLQRTYPDCRMRWSDVRECYRLERRANYGRADVNPATYPRNAVDTFTMMRDGYYLVREFAVLPNADRLVQVLCANDPNKMDLGTDDPVEQAVRYTKMIDEQEAARKFKGRIENSFEHSGVGADLYDQLAWAEGRRVAVPNTATGVND